MENYLTRATLLIYKSKILDRVLIVEAYPPLYFLIEIRKTWSLSNALAFKIIQTTKEKYQEGTLPAEQNFEEALEVTNEMLAKLTEEGQTEWLGNLSAIIALVHKNKISLASVGTASCFLIRDQNLTEITESQPKETHPLKTFSHILNGKIASQDKLIMGNLDFFENFSSDYLKQTLTKKSTKEAASLIVRSLQKDKIKTANALILEIKTGPASFVPPPEFCYIDQKRKLWQGFGQGLKILAKRVYSRVKKAASRLFEIVPVTKIKVFSKKIPLVRYLKARKKWLLLGLLILVLLALGFGIFNKLQKGQEQEKLLSQKRAIIQAEEITKQAQEAQGRGDNEEAKKLYLSALTYVGQIETKEGTSLRSKITAQLDKLNKIIRVKSPKETIDFGKTFPEAQVFQIFIIDKVPYSVDLKTNQIYQGDKNPSNLPQYSGQPVSGTYQSPENLLIFYQDPEGIYEYKIDENQLEKAKVIFEGKWEKSKILASFYTNLYLLNTEEGQIYKHEKTAAGYSKGTAYIDKTKVDLKRAVSMATDGYIYVLNEDGSAFKLLAGRPVSDFAFKGLPEPDAKLKKPLKIFTSSAIPYLYILDESRILEMDKSGNYLRMFVFDLPDIKDIWINYRNKKIYLLSGSKVYETGM